MRDRKRRAFTALAMAGALIAGLPGPAGNAQAAPPAEPAKARRLTLVTGDLVTVRKVGGRALLQVEPGPGRRSMGFRQLSLDGRSHLIPADALRLIGTGRLDRRLFDIDRLLEWNYDDAHRPDVPLIVERSGRGPAAVRGASATADLSALGLDALKVDKRKAAMAWAGLVGGARAGSLGGGATRVWLDGRRATTLDRSVPQVGAPKAWKRGWTGKNTTVAVLDTGYDPAHPDLKGVVTQSRGFTDQGAASVNDTVGHGTHVSSIVAGTGAASRGRYKGVAPGAKLAVGKVFNDDGDTQDSWILAGMQWAATRAKVVNMSFGGWDFADIDPLERAVNTLTARTGTLFVISSGNEGDDGNRPVSSPGSADAALTVGAVDKADRLADFSRRGPRRGDRAIKPDMTAPGVAITAAAAKGTEPGHYVAYSGTSMATPHVAGAAAILAQRHPDWKAGRLKAALTNTAKPGAYGVFEQGAGRLDVDRAVNQPVTADTGNISVRLTWPGRTPITRAVTYANSGAAAVTLRLAVPSTPKGMFKVDAKEITVPAHGTARVRLTIDGKGAKAGDHTGVLTASATGVTVRTVLGAHAEPKSHDLTVRALGRDGKPAEDLLLVEHQRSPRQELILTTGGTSRLRLPEGAYNVRGVMLAPLNENCWAPTLVNTPVTLTGARTVTLDGRSAKQMKMTVDEPTARPVQGIETGLHYRDGKVSYVDGWSQEGCPLTAGAVLPARQAKLSFFQRATFIKAGSTAANPSPYRYALYDHRTGGLPNDPRHHARKRDLAARQVTFRASGSAEPGLRVLAAAPPGFEELLLNPAPNLPVRLPSTVTEYLTPNPKLWWYRTLLPGADDPDTALHTVTEEGRVTAPGVRRETWNAAVVGPSLTFADTLSRATAVRTGNTIAHQPVSMHADGQRGREGLDVEATGTTTLHQGGKLIKKITYEERDLTAVVPAGAAAYTITVDARRQSVLSNRIVLAWRFRSARTARATKLPVQVVRYAPAGLDAYNRAKPNSVTRLPLWVERQPGSAGKVRTITVEISHDDGKTWRRTALKAAPGGWNADVRNPARGFVSLRATVTDTTGASVTQTILRAYAIGG